MLGDDPEFEEGRQPCRIVSRDARRWCSVLGSEKSAIQAPDRLDQFLPLPADHAEWHGFEYFASNGARSNTGCVRTEKDKRTAVEANRSSVEVFVASPEAG